MQPNSALSKNQLQKINKHTTELLHLFNELLEEKGLGAFVITTLTLTPKDQPFGKEMIPFCSIGEEPAAVCDKDGKWSVSCIKN